MPKEELKYSGAIYPAKGEARYTEKIDKQGRIPVPRLIRDKLGIHEHEAMVTVSIKVLEVYGGGTE